MSAEPNWMKRASCRAVPGFTERPQLEQHGVCASCPVRIDCKEFGLTAFPIPAVSPSENHHWPLLGGLTPEELRRIARSRRQSRVPA